MTCLFPRQIDDHAAALCASPAGCAFLLVVEENGLPTAAASDPALAIHIAAIALSQMNVWRSNHDEDVAEALAHGLRLAPLARAILSRPHAARWFAPLDRQSQWCIARSASDITPASLLTPASPPASWERYAQKPRQPIFSSTAFGNTCSILAAMEWGAGDYRVEPPIVRVRVQAAPEARVFEVTGPNDWHNLATRYPAIDEDGRTVPDWGLVAQDWDAVHLTLGGLLTAEQVRVAHGEAWTEHRFWDAEQTAWLRWRFNAVERQPDLAEPPSPPVALVEASFLFLTRDTESAKIVRPRN